MARAAKKTASVAGKRPSDSEISEMLNVEHIGAKKTDLDPAKLDPVQPMPMVVRLEQMDTYTDNPRQGQNPVFNELYDRIIAQGGLTDVLQITRRPGSDRYILAAGGNTRLELLRKAFNETQDDRFTKFNALFVPYENEYKLQINHHAENNQRGSTTFIENALHVLKIKHTAEDELDKTFNQSELVRELKSQGFTIDRKSLRLYEYTVERLVGHMPKALYAGMGRPKIQEIKNVESKLRDYTAFKGFNEDRFTLIFEQSLTENDTEEGFHLDHFENDMVIKLSDGLGLDIGTFEYELDGYLQEGEDSYVFKESADSRNLSAASMGTSTGSLSELFDDDPSYSGDAGPDVSESNTTLSTRPVKPGKQQTPFERIDQLQKQAARHAERLAMAVNITDCLQINLNGLGHGYWVDIPADGRQLDSRQSGVWWHLFACSGISNISDLMDDIQSLEYRVQALPDHNKLKQVLLKNPDSLKDPHYYQVFFDISGDPNQMNTTLFFLTDPDVEERLDREFIGLSSTCRELLITANKNGLTQELWTKK